MITKIDYDKIATEYARHRQVHPRVLKNLLETSGVGKTSTVLEVGCGTGNYILAVESLTGAACRGDSPRCSSDRCTVSNSRCRTS